MRCQHRNQSALDEREVLPPGLEAGTGTTVAFRATHGIEFAHEFTQLEYPTELLDNDQPMQCPLPEPSILNDGIICKE